MGETYSAGQVMYSLAWLTAFVAVIVGLPWWGMHRWRRGRAERAEFQAWKQERDGT